MLSAAPAGKSGEGERGAAAVEDVTVGSRDVWPVGEGHREIAAGGASSFDVQKNTGV
jgi:hypothetical protein